MINNILLVCIGNVCRSPMAEALLNRSLPDKVVYSAGINALIGAPADRVSVQLMWEQGIDISAHRARHLASWMVNDANLVLTMDQYQKNYIERKYPESKNKVFRLGEFGNYDIPDPFHQNVATFRRAFDLIAHGIDSWTVALHKLVRNQLDTNHRPLDIQPEHLMQS